MNLRLLLACTAVLAPPLVACSSSAPGGPVTEDGGAADACARSCLEADAGEDGARITLSRLLGEMVDLSWLATLPDPPFTSHLASSHDPLSDDAEPGSTDWFANRDFIELQAGSTAVLLDTEGPGVITRIWSASPAGTIQIYIDGAEEPTVSGDFKSLLSGEIEPFVTPFAFVAAFGHNLYYPIPFSRSCRITLTGESTALYFHVGYRTYAEGTEVESFSVQSMMDAEAMQARVADRLSDLGAESATVEGDVAQSFELSTAGDHEALVASDDGGGVIWELRAQPSDTSPEALKSTTLTIAFDGIETVRAPLGDFFASSAGTEIRSVPIGVIDGVMTARWAMPFAESARIRIEAADGVQQDVALEVISAALPWTERSVHFNAQWQAPETFASKPSGDWNLATIEGTGFYVGNVLNVVNRSESWWGEGDEKIFVDDEAFPSHFGTGTEDYYGYAWCSNEVFSESYIGQPVASERQNFGPTSLYRFHVLDAIPFERSLRFDMEVRHWGPAVDMTYDALSFWYALPGSRMIGAPAESTRFQVPVLNATPPASVPVAAYRCRG